MADEPQPPAVVKGEIERGQFIETFDLREGSMRLKVPANAIAARAQAQMNVGKCQAFFERAIKFYEDNPKEIPSPKELKILVEAASTINDMAAQAYSNTLKGKGGDLANALERMVFAATAGAAAGSQKGLTTEQFDSHSRESRMARMMQVGKANEAKVVEKVPPAEQEPLEV